jgi:hypothetical protein
MALTVGTDTYATLADIQAWNTARGYTGAITEADVLRAMDYIESLPWADERGDDDSDLWWGDDPPDAVVTALKHAARMENESPGVLMPETQQKVAREKVDVIEIEYEPGGNQQMFPALLRYLRGYVASSSVINVRLV